MRLKSGALAPLEVALLEAAMDFMCDGIDEFHGYLIANRIRQKAKSRSLPAFGSLYKALDRLETDSFLTSRWEDVTVAVNRGRPPRRLYRVTAAGHHALATAALGTLHRTGRAIRQAPAHG